MDKETVPRTGWLLVGLLAATILASVVNAILSQYGFSEEYHAITVITAMAPVLIYVGVWYDDDRQHYWEHSTIRILGDLVFVLLGALAGSALVLLALLGTLPWILEEIVAMAGGFAFGWGLFWWRNPELYREDSGR
ncbi:hypothetical protein [Halopiger goleimassiliensis]|uniref:hypothetical protein n=1 Tax=Halopiger goleimassiliensis TaxID=1293048 RepID=UPI0006776315|nr:hypothetical protein [Halopiger goleimassiliensis]